MLIAIRDGEYSDRDTIIYDSDDQQGGIFSESSSHTDEVEPPIQQQPRKKRKQTQSKFPSTFNQDNWDYWDKENIEPLVVFTSSDEARIGFTFDIQGDDIDELFFFEKFIGDTLINDMTVQTNLYSA